LRDQFKERTKCAVDDCLPLSNKSMTGLVENLKQQNIYVVLRQNAENRLYGITFVDNTTKCVFNGSDLGKGYSAAAIQSRLADSTADKQIEMKDKNTGSSTGGSQKEFIEHQTKDKSISTTSRTESPLDVLLSNKEQYDNVLGNLMKKKRKKKKRKNNNL
jgi:hypothetical protein